MLGRRQGWPPAPGCTGRDGSEGESRLLGGQQASASPYGWQMRKQGLDLVTLRLHLEALGTQQQQPKTY